jgi:putative cardiolipin synthase
MGLLPIARLVPNSGENNVRIIPVLIALFMVGCSTLPRGADSPKTPSFALERPQETPLGKRFLAASARHQGESGYHIINSGIDGFVTRIQMIDAAERTIDMQYFIFRGDKTGLLIAEALKRAADRGVRVRILVDDGDTVAGDQKILALGRYPHIEVRIFNPFDYRGHNAVLRQLDFLVHKGRLDYRMHNKLMVVDNCVALIGGRNVGAQYFQVEPESQFADDDAFAAGEIGARLSKTFDSYWNSDFAVPSTSLPLPEERSKEAAVSFEDGGMDYRARIASGRPFQDLIVEDGALHWANAAVVCDSPDKKDVEERKKRGHLMAPEVTRAMREAGRELLMVTPYFVPSDTEIALLGDLRERKTTVRILSNSLESAPALSAQSGYDKFRIRLLESGAQLYEVRALLSSTRGSGETRAISRYGTYGLHAKLYVMDRQRLYIGSMNYDQRSWRINTEVGLLLESPEVAEEIAHRFDAMVSPDAAYRVFLDSDTRGKPALRWAAEIDHRPVEFVREPSRGFWQRAKVRVLGLLPIEREL